MNHEDQLEQRRDGSRLLFRSVCVCGWTSDWVSSAGLAHGCFAAHRERETPRCS